MFSFSFELVANEDFIADLHDRYAGVMLMLAIVVD